MSLVKIEVSARHAHFTRHDLEQLFGEGYELVKEKELSQSGQFASADTVVLVGPKHSIENVRIIGPCRGHTQIEVSRSDCFFLGAKAPLRLSGKVIRSGPIKVVGPKGELELSEGLIVAKRHLHAAPEQAAGLGLSSGQNVKISVEGPRALVFHEVEVRVDEGFELVVDLDTDEGNAAGIEKAGEGRIIVD